MKIPEAFRGNCDCGLWLIIPASVPEEDPIYCACGRSYWYNHKQQQYERTEHPIIFLDIDGVLINVSGASRPHPDCIAGLHHIASKTRAVIVVTSVRREAGRGVVKAQLRRWGVVTPVVDVTPNLSRNEDGIWIGVKRGEEIQAWLDMTKRNDVAFVILDDDADMAHLTAKLIRTEYVTGLTKDDALLATRLLEEDVVVCSKPLS